MKPMDILVLFGGCSTEYGVSLESAHAVLSHMNPEKYRPIPVGITREGAWYWYPGPLEAIPQDRWRESPPASPAPAAGPGKLRSAPVGRKWTGDSLYSCFSGAPRQERGGRHRSGAL